ncbi:NAD+ diphosphatase [Colwellia chukchiensis]|uniref:NAD(+) diphosphatase n=1 Tax=Colwellia chukchiensis TaxID=641665 RepID=A0A1H7FZ96_9GAMM|nr:NAD(+) diphosphatase [Colwellia chukchiensis]SEK31124.1 NAD+ diphosphatase [Colwellia chukchiensis]
MNNNLLKQQVKNNELTFCQMPLERASMLRKDPAWLQTQQMASSSRFYFFWRGHYLYAQQDIAIFSEQGSGGFTNKHSQIRFLKQTLSDHALLFLGLGAMGAEFVCDLSCLSATEIETWRLNTDIIDAHFHEFRGALPLLSSPQAAILSYAQALSHWQQTALYCGSCGEKTDSLDGGHRRRCLNSQCQKEQFPRTDPVVIMLVEHQPATGPAMCLLAEHHRTPSQVFSTLAGFIDPGESLQEAVYREVLEEAGLKVSNVRYFDSQPWPFPNSIMLGFIAQADDMALSIEPDELRSAQWFTAQQLTEFNEWGDVMLGPKLPRKESIARLLIDSWCQQQLMVANDKAEA